ncbi:hypothetical protein LguiA_027054 [Lonicera macranthoides]
MTGPIHLSRLKSKVSETKNIASAFVDYMQYIRKRYQFVCIMAKLYQYSVM